MLPKQLKAVFLLIDIRHEPSGNDKMMYEWIVSQGFNPVIIATKLDKIKRSQKDKQIKIVKRRSGSVAWNRCDSIFIRDETGTG